MLAKTRAPVVSAQPIRDIYGQSTPCDNCGATSHDKKRVCPDCGAEKLVGMFICFWCEQSFFNHERTRDHLVPQSLRGGDNSENIVHACMACNNNRGILTGYFGGQRRLKRIMNARVRKHSVEELLLEIDIHNRQLEWMRAFQAEWMEREQAKIGFSPSGYMKFVELSFEEPLDLRSTDVRKIFR